MASASRSNGSKAGKAQKRDVPPTSRGKNRRPPVDDCRSTLVDQLLARRLPAMRICWLVGPRERLVVVGPLEPGEGQSRLTATEEDVLRLLIAAKSNEQIARERCRSSRTVANQVKSIFRKLGVSSRRELFALLFQRTPPA
jgi:DNA-binding CsgD family transcriptional regulator